MARTLFRCFVLSIAALTALALLAMLARDPSARADDPLPFEGTSQDCVDFKLDILSGFITDVLELGVLDDLGIYDIDEEVFKADLPDEGWVWADPENHYREVEGIVTVSKTAAIDFPATHDSHDQNTLIRVDAEYKGLLGRVNSPNAEGVTPLVAPEIIEMEWEHGTFVDETGRNEPERFFPRWAWPAAGDRVWTEGHWVLDCGHATSVDGADHFRTEIHPARAIASMRQQVHALPGSGTTQVPVTATDLYAHGRAGFMMEILTHGQGVILDDVFDPSDDVNDHLKTPIDQDIDFDICLPPQPSPAAVPAYSWEVGPGNNIAIDPELTVEEAEGPCAETGSKEVHVHVPLTGSGVSPDQVYARKIYAGWVYPADSLRHIIVKLDQMDLHTDKEVEFSLGGDCECTFFYVNIDAASDEWFRLADWWEETCNIMFDPPDFQDPYCIDYNQLYDYDSDELLGNGLLDFSGPTFDFLVANGQPFHIRSSGYDQDCADDLFNLPLVSHHYWNALTYSLCYYATAITTFEKGRNDDFARLNVCFVETDTNLCDDASAEQFTGYGIGSRDLSAAGEYELEFTVSEEEVTEDPADLALTKTCSWEGEVALAGHPFTCEIIVTNAGPGLPKNVVVSDTLTTLVSGSDYAIGTPTYTVTSGSESGAAQPCDVTPPNEFSCAIGSVPAGGNATIEVEITPSKPGLFANAATVSSDTQDLDTTNNDGEASVDVFLPVQIDIKPGNVPNSVNLTPGGTVAVAALKTADFDPAVIDFATVCFGDAGDPAQRDCSEVHNKEHRLDVDKDRDVDVTLHYEVDQTGIDPGDTSACLIGRTTGGIGIYGCDSVRTL